MRLGRIVMVVVLAGAIAGGVSACLAGNAADDVRPLALSVLSSRPDMVSGGDALLEIDLGGRGSTAVGVTVNGQDVTAAFRQVQNGRLVGLVEGLEFGVNDVMVSVETDTASRRLTLVNHPVAGPIFSGPTHIFASRPSRLGSLSRLGSCPSLGGVKLDSYFC